MGIFNRFINRKGSELSTGNHAIAPVDVLRQTHDTAPRPMQPGNYPSLRTAPVLESPRYFSEAESKALQERAKEIKTNAKHTEKAFQALESIEDSDLQVHQAYYGYLSKMATNETAKLKATAGYAAKLHQLRPQYAGLQAKIIGAERTASDRIAALTDRLNGVTQGDLGDEDDI